MNKTGKKLAPGIALALAISSLVGCGGGGEIGVEYDFTESDKTISYTWYSANWQDFEGRQHDGVIKFLEEKFNVNLNITGASGTAWQSRLTTEIADNNTPDVFFSLPDTSTYTDYIKKSIITDLNPYIEKADAKNLKQVLGSEQYKKSALIDGKNYFLPQSVGYTTRLILARKDWMAKWNTDSVANGGRGFGEDKKFEQPETLSEFTSMLTYFREKDPDGDGKKNTYGMGLSTNFDYVQDFFATFGLSPEYYLDANGDFAYSVYNENYQKMADWFKVGNDSGYIQTAFYSITEDDATRNFYQGKTGVFVTTGNGMLDGLCNAMEEYYSNKDVDYKDLITLLTPPDSDDGKYQGAFKGWNYFWGGWSISAEAEEPMRLIRIFDYLVSPEGQDLMNYGVKDLHYTEENGVKTLNLENRLAEGVPAVFLSTVNKPNVLNGRYSLGGQWMPNPFKYNATTNMLEDNYPYDLSRDPELMKLSHDLIEETTPNFNALRTIISNPDMSEYNTRIIDAVKTYTINLIAGKNKADELAALNAKMKSYRSDELLKYLNENNK